MHEKLKIGRFQVKFSPWRRQVGKNRRTAFWEIIFRRFRIWNQIFDSFYRSRDIARSLDTTFDPNLNFLNDFLENKFWKTVFVGWKALLRATFSEKMGKIVSSVSEKISKNLRKWDILVIFEWSGIFWENPASSLLSDYRCLTSCKVSLKSLQPFLRKMDN